jgi:hypothetical protein
MASEPVTRWVVWHPVELEAHAGDTQDGAWFAAQCAEDVGKPVLVGKGWTCSPVTREAGDGGR